MMRKGVILAGGTGSRLHPVTQAVSKQLLPVYDKPLIYYPLSVLMLAGIREILLICRSADQHLFQRLLGDGSRLGLQISYASQDEARGVADALLVGESFIQDSPVCLILGDNIFYGDSFSALVTEATAHVTGAQLFAYYVSDPQRYGVVEFDRQGRPVALEEKPAHPRSNYAVTGMYWYDGRAVELARTLRPSARGELEITELNRLYLDRGELDVTLLGRGIGWLDVGTHDALQEASAFVAAIERRTSLKVCCPEEIAFRKGYIDRRELAALAAEIADTDYGRYLAGLVESLDAG
jgi:glucose-1-phosphate thymidylyltransferase